MKRYENIKCPICAGEETIVTGEQCRYGKIKYKMFLCKKCGSEFAHPRLPAPPEYYEYETPTQRWEFFEVVTFLKEQGIRDSVLDIGCAEGNFLSILKNEGIEGEGIDFNETKVAKAQGRGLNCQVIAIEDLNKNKKYKAITLFHILEHLSHPREFLKKIRNYLVNSGFLFCSFPNMNRYHIRFARDVGDYPPHHLQRISHYGLLKMAKDLGYRIFWYSVEPYNTTFRHALSLTANRLLNYLGIRYKVRKYRYINYPIKAFFYSLSLPWVVIWQLAPVKKEGDTVLYCLQKVNES